MARGIKKQGKKVLIFGLILILVGMYVGVPIGQAAPITNREMRISDSRPGQTGVTYDFEGDHSTTVVRCLRVQYCTTATGPCTTPPGMITTTATKGPAAEWSGWTHADWTISTTTAGEIRYTNGAGQAGGVNFSFSTANITNSTTSGTYFARVTTYTNTDCSTGETDSGVVAFAIISGVTVTAIVAETLVVEVTGVSAADCTQSSGTSVTTTATAVPFGVIAPATFYRGCQNIRVATNAANGFVMTTQEQTNLRYTTINIPDTTCDATGCSEVTARPWVSTGFPGYGHSCYNIVGTPCNTVYAADNFRQFACRGTDAECDPGTGGETPQMFMSTTGPADVTGRILHRIAISPLQAAGSYSATVVYIATPIY